MNNNNNDNKSSNEINNNNSYNNNDNSYKFKSAEIKIINLFLTKVAILASAFLADGNLFWLSLQNTMFVFLH